MTDGRRTLGDISRAVNNLDRNPTRLLFGASSATSPSAASASTPTPPPAGPRRAQ
jgi:phospholipid/cholesterol/gamma-HCH transport system substrate-binding protein